MAKKSKSDVDALDREIPEDPWAAKPLSLAGTARLIDFLGASLDDAAERVQIEQALKEKEGKDVFVNPILALLKIFSEDRIAELLAIITRQSSAWIKKNWKLAKATRAIEDFIASEDLGAVLGNLLNSRNLLAGILAEEEDTGSQESLTDSLPNTEEPPTTG